MDRALLAKIRGDKAYAGKLIQLTREYITLGHQNVEYWVPEWDAAHDLLMCYAPLTKKDLETLEKGHPKRFVLPLTATQIATMSTFIAQSLFGDDCPNKVEPMGPEDDIPSEHVNRLLKWNALQQPTYLLGYLFIQDALTFNRGIFYHSWQPVFRPETKLVEVEVPGELDSTGQPLKCWSVRRHNKKIGAFCKAELVSPYDWFCDPTLPLWKAQEGRFMGHRFKVSWHDLKRRSELAPDDPAYVMPEAVEQLKAKRKQNSNLPPSAAGHGSATGTRPDMAMSRSFYERQRVTGPLAAEAANKADPGSIECNELWVRMVPKDQGIHDGEESVVFQFLVAGDVLLAINESTYDHGQFPYAFAEGRPNGHFQFAPSWAFTLKGIQDHVDYLKNRHQDALQRTVGNVFVANANYVDLEDFLNPDKEGMIIPLKPSALGMKISDVIQQIPIKDLTERFPEEMTGFISYSESVTGANNNMQGVSDGQGSATEFAGTQQMAAGRMASVARMISVQALVPQTRQFVSMFQQFMEDVQKVRYVADPFTSPQELQGVPVLEISRDTIQGEFDFQPHDGSLPSGDQKKVAAISRLIQAAAAFPQVFMPAPGNIDPRQLLLVGAKAAGLNNVERYLFTEQSAAPMQASSAAAAIGGSVPPQSAPAGAPPGPAPATPAVPDVQVPSVAPVAASQPRPETL